MYVHIIFSLTTKGSFIKLSVLTNTGRHTGTGVVNRMKKSLRKIAFSCRPLIRAYNRSLFASETTNVESNVTGFRRLTQTLIVVGVFALATGCASGTKNVPLNIQSDPLGAYVVFQITKDNGAKSDWIFLGNTPLLTTRQYSKEELRDENSIVLKVMKEGFFDQTKVFKGRELRRESKSKGRVFWNPRMVPN